jgi:hypothetical protein
MVTAFTRPHRVPHLQPQQLCTSLLMWSFRILPRLHLLAFGRARAQNLPPLLEHVHVHRWEPCIVYTHHVTNSVPAGAHAMNQPLLHVVCTQLKHGRGSNHANKQAGR